MSETKERKLICKLLTDTVSYDEFLDSEDIASENGQMIATLVGRLSLSWPEELPKLYKLLLGNISKYSSVAGFMQALRVSG